MAKIVDVSKTIQTMEYDLAKIKFVQQHFPKMKLQVDEESFLFSDRTVNSNFNNYTFYKNYYDLRMGVHHELDFVFNNKTEIVVVDSLPRQTMIATQYKINNEYEIRVLKPPFKSKDKERQKDLMENYYKAVIEFITARKGMKINKEYLPPRLEKLLMFT